ncbi:HD domain-containing protein [Aspergillus stella-maris]|uniref:HD domain-containing protein n=1 Tax=Aspergillus stella-maris TaxID=1810926 RepID=UPI003CCCE2D0
MGSETPSDSTWTPQSVLSTLPCPLEENSTSPVPFFHLLERLKTTKREGWRRFDINHGESISDHMYRMSVMTMLAPPSLASRLNLQHCMKMALVHDMAESLVGDITPIDPIKKTEKARREAAVMEYIAGTLLRGVPSGMLAGDDILAVFNEYEANETLEAQFVHDVDKMELLLQMVEYERSYEIDLDEFLGVAKRIHLPEIQEWAATVLKEREELWKSRQQQSTSEAAK